MITTNIDMFRFLTIAILGISCLLIPSAIYSVTEDSYQKCLHNQGYSAIKVCSELATQLSTNRTQLFKLGLELEQQQDYNKALVVYDAGIEKFPNDKALLRQRITVFRYLREQKKNINLDTPSIQQGELFEAIDLCIRERFSTALKGCEEALKVSPNDAILLDSYGDVLRSMGRINMALKAYEKSLIFNSQNRLVKQKYDALLSIHKKNTSKPIHEKNKQNPINENFTVAISSAENDGIIRNFRLLDKLYKDQLISETEYQRRKTALLDNTFSENLERSPGHANPESTYFSNGQYHALIIGNTNYEKLPRLKTALNDAKAIESMLQTKYGFSTTLIENGSRYEVLKHLSILRSTLTKKDNLLIYYAGHGVLDEVTGRGYWLPIEAEKDNFAHWISTNDIIDALNGMEAKHALVVSDSCFSGALLRDTGRLNTTQINVIQRLAEKRSRTVLTSGGLEPVLDSGGGKHSVFAKAFLDSLENNQSIIEASKLFDTLRQQVITNADQTPEYANMQRARHEGGDFIFIPRLTH